MIDEDRTMQLYGYTSDMLKQKSNKMIVVVCEECGKYRDLEKYAYRELCKPCAQTKRFEDPMEREKVSAPLKKYWAYTESRKKASEKTKKMWSDQLFRENMSGENSCHWRGGITEQKYCSKFNDDIRQYIRDKYNNCDYISGVHKDVCNPDRELSVHHVDYNKQQGCEDHKWKLIPLSQKNHCMTNANRPFWNHLFTYALQYDKTYYENGCTDVLIIL